MSIGRIFVATFLRGIFQGKEQGIGSCDRDESSSIGYEIDPGRYFGIKGRACLFFFRVSSDGLLISDRGGFGRLLADMRRFGGESRQCGSWSVESTAQPTVCIL